MERKFHKDIVRVTKALVRDSCKGHFFFFYCLVYFLNDYLPTFTCSPVTVVIRDATKATFVSNCTKW